MAVDVLSIENAPNPNPNSNLTLSLYVSFCTWVKKTSRRQIVSILALRYTRVNMLQLHHRRRPSLPGSMGRSVETQRTIACRTKCLHTVVL